MANKVLEESTAVAKKAAESLGGTFEQGKGYTPGKTNVNASAGAGDDAFLSELQNHLISGAERVSSADTDIERGITKALNATRKGGDASSARISSQYDRAISEAMGTGQSNIDAFAEERGGFATQMAGLRKVVETTDKNLNDLGQRKQEALLLNDSQTAAKITELELQGLSYKQQAMQTAFNNLLSVSNFGLSAKQFQENKRQFGLNYEMEGKKFQLAKDTQSAQERQAMASIAAEFGIELDPNDTIDTVVTKAAQTGAVSQRRALEMESLRAQIRASNAAAAKALKGDPGDKPFDPVMAEVLARAHRQGDTDFLKGLNPEQAGQVYQKYLNIQQEDMGKLAEIAKQSSSVKDFNDRVSQDTYAFDPAQVKTAEALVATQKSDGFQFHDVGDALRGGVGWYVKNILKE